MRSHFSAPSKQESALLQHLHSRSTHADCSDLRLKRSVKHTALGNKFHSSTNCAKSSAVKPDLDCSDDTSQVSSSLVASRGDAAVKPRWESEGRIRLMDSGMSNNLPNHVLARPERCADLILAFDASSDVQSGLAIQRIQNFADDCHLKLEDQTALFKPPRPRFRAGADGTRSIEMEVESKFLYQYARVFRGERENGQEVYLIYCPLLPNGANPEFDPSVSTFNSMSYNGKKTKKNQKY